MNRRTPLKGRGSKTNYNKIRKLKNTYRKLFKNSQQCKKQNIRSNYKIVKQYFFEKYPTLESFLKLIKIKNPNKNV